MGRKNIPKRLHELKGRPGKRPLKDEPEPDVMIPDPPEHLGKIALAEWRYIAPQLFKLGLISALDRTALAAYCQCYERWALAEAHIQLHGMTTTTKNGIEYQSPYVGIANTALLLMHKYLTEFGMTPAARSRVSPAKVKKGKGEWSDFGKDGQK